MKKIDVKSPENLSNEVAPETVPIQEYDGVETWKEREVDGKEVVFTRKINLSESEARALLGGRDPKIYFRNGKVPIFYKSLGDLLPEDREETKLLRQTMPSFPDVLLFKHKYEQLYQLLIPKQICEFELDNNEEIVDSAIHCDTRSIVFGSQSSPKSFEKNYFRQRVKMIDTRLRSAAERLISYSLTKN